jgi:hypothetical protein
MSLDESNFEENLPNEIGQIETGYEPIARIAPDKASVCLASMKSASFQIFSGWALPGFRGLNHFSGRPSA